MVTEPLKLFRGWLKQLELPEDAGDKRGVESCIYILEDEPTVDAVEVVHGRWVLAKPRVKGRNATYRCTACGKLRSSYYNDVFQWEYCPCGAKMDGDGNG